MTKNKSEVAIVEPEVKSINISVENREVGQAVKGFFANYKAPIMEYLTQFLGQGGAIKVDPGITVSNEGEISVYQVTPDKGPVLAEVENTGPYDLALVPYSEVPVEVKYVIQEKERLGLYWKRPEGEADIKLGLFKSLEDAVSEIDSEGVNAAIKNAQDWLKAKAKDTDRADRLAHPRIKAGELPDAEIVEEHKHKK